MADIQMISPPVYVFGADGGAHTVFGWLTEDGCPITPVVSNPDGPGIGAWYLYYGNDPWSTHA